jgi:hypothetical protein
VKSADKVTDYPWFDQASEGVTLSRWIRSHGEVLVRSKLAGDGEADSRQP